MMNIRLTFAAFLAAAALPVGVQAEPMGCLIQPFQEAEVGAQVVGILDRVMVERGDLVKRGQPVAMLNSDVERAATAAARLRAEATAELQAAASNHDFAQKKKVRTQDLYRQNFVSQQVKDQASTEADVAEMRLKQAREQMRQAHQELALAQAQLAQRTIRSPFTGVVVERYLHEGERVEDKPVVKVATVDPLRVEVIVPSSHFNKIKQGMTASVKPEMADVELRSAKVVVVDRMIDAASNSFRVRLELPNPGNELPPGLRCKVEFDGLNAASQDAAIKPQQPAGRGEPASPSGKPVGSNTPAKAAAQQKQSVAVAPAK
jgi:RND family efflux transporter MFP subunit